MWRHVAQFRNIYFMSSIAAFRGIQYELKPRCRRRYARYFFREARQLARDYRAVNFKDAMQEYDFNDRCHRMPCVKRQANV